MKPDQYIPKRFSGNDRDGLVPREPLARSFPIFRPAPGFVLNSHPKYGNAAQSVSGFVFVKRERIGPYRALYSGFFPGFGGSGFGRRLSRFHSSLRQNPYRPGRICRLAAGNQQDLRPFFSRTPRNGRGLQIRRTRHARGSFAYGRRDIGQFSIAFVHISSMTLNTSTRFPDGSRKKSCRMPMAALIPSFTEMPADSTRRFTESRS